MNLLYTAHIPAGEGPFPAIIALHGWGASAHDLLGLAPMLHGGRALMLCPQGPVAVPFGGGQYGYGWFPMRPGMPPDIEAFHRGAEALRRFVDTALGRYPIDPRRVVLAGFSQGGMMGYDLALREPSRFAGLAALSTWFPPPLAEDLPKLPEHEGFPVLVIHGTRDDRIEVERARESREALRPYGVSITYREFDMGHEIRQDALRVVLQWLDDKALKRAEAETPRV
ncbi:MAG TPA: alpha/beta hydrolase-fold protein [Thermoanaerobaculia bacterium]|jgi:phospholipase/carboxylesterase